jgi:cell volume regulation protein A
MSGYILAAAVIILLCLLCSKVSGKFGIPTLLAFIFLGMLFGSDGIFKIPFSNYEMAEQICSIALVYIMFYGGFGTNWNQAKPIAIKSVLLSSVGVVLTAFITGIFCYKILQFDFWESMLIGSVISSTDAASVFSILRSKHLNLKHNTASLLEVESGSNDPCANMMTVIVLTFMGGSLSGGEIGYMIFAQIVYGVTFGVIAALAAWFILTKHNIMNDGFDSIFVFSIALVSYAGALQIGGNGYLSVYITGIILGNLRLHNKKTLVHFFDGVTGLMQILLFFLLGLLSFPSQLPQIILPALEIAVVLTFVARPIAVFAILTPFRCPIQQQLLVSWSGLRGAASIVFSIMAVVSPAYGKTDVFHIVFCIVLFSIAIQGTLIPFVSKKLNMIDDNSDVMKTFSDYSEEVPVQFIQSYITETHPWAHKQIKELSLLPDMLIVLVNRKRQHIVPKGDTKFMPGDVVVISGPALEGESFGFLSEITIEKDHKALGKKLSELKLGPNQLVILIKRAGTVVIPSGQTVLEENDILIMNELDV